MVLIGTAGMALFSWLNDSLIALNRIRENNAIAEAKLNALEYMNTINPMLRAEGEANLGSYQINWKANPTTEIKDNVGYPRGRGLYAVALYDTRVSVTLDPKTPWFDFNFKQVGYKRVREIQLPF